ncbi:hypothetical protein BDP27DRAFT_1328522, partial [Rhodocollybia butyracea]
CINAHPLRKQPESQKYHCVESTEDRELSASRHVSLAPGPRPEPEPALSRPFLGARARLRFLTSPGRGF